MQQQGGQFGGSGSNQNQYYMPAPSPYQQQGTPMSSFVHSPGSAIEPSPGGGVYSHLHQQQQSQQMQSSFQYMAPSPAQQTELSRTLGFGSAPSSVGSPISGPGAGSTFRSQPSSLQQMLPPTPQPSTPRAGPMTPASVGPVGSVGPGDYGTSFGGPGSVNPATPRSVGEPLSVSDQQQQSSMKGVTSSSASNFAAALLDQDSNSQFESTQPQQQPLPLASTVIDQQRSTSDISGRSGLGSAANLSNQNLAEMGANVSALSRAQGLASSTSGISAAAQSLQNLEQYGPLALCSMGKELTQELVNRTADMFMMLKAVTDPNSQFPKTASPESLPQLQAKEKRLNDSLRNTAALVHRLYAISTRLEQLSKDRLPSDAHNLIKDLLPYAKEQLETSEENGDQMEVDQGKTYLEEVRSKAENREEYQLARVEHEKTKAELIQKREHVKKIMDFVRDFCWEISNVLDSNVSS